MIRVLRAGPLTTVQDFGRVGLGHIGVARAGAVDRLSLRLANRLVGNPDDGAAFECTLRGPHLQFDAGTSIAVTGGDVDVRVDGDPVEMNRTVLVPAESTVDVGNVKRGVRCYVSVAGGIHADEVLSSRSTDTLSGIGPAVIRDGDEIEQVARTVDPRVVADGYDLAPIPLVLRVVAGPHPVASADGEYVVSATSDRTGVRFTGPAIEAEPHVPSMGLVEGALQVPPDGQPIALLANHQTIGGYAVPFVVIDADLPRLAQARPGTHVRFEVVSLERAAELATLQRSWLDAAVALA